MTWHRIGHRGAPRAFPGNTLRGFEHARALGCTMIECDVRQTADGVLVLAHDPHVTSTRSAGKRYEVSRHSSATLRVLDLGAGEGVPTLTELVAWAQACGDVGIMADMKIGGGDVEAGVVEALAPLPASRKIVPGAGQESRRQFRALDPNLPLSLSLGADSETRALLADDGLDRLLDNLDTEAVTWEHPLLTAARIAALHARGLRVYAWTVDDLPTMRRLQGDGVDGIISNRADLLQTL